MTRVAVVIPSRSDRPKFMAQCLSMMEAQTRKPDHVIVVDYPPKDAIPDLVPRYRDGFDKAFNLHKCDLAICIENDDVYTPEYIAFIVEAWERSGKPQVFGLNRTIYYNINTNKYVILSHPGRASMMSMAVSPAIMNHQWPHDDYTYLDWHLWVKDKTMKKVSVPCPLIAIGIKHGIGLCGGGGHTEDWAHYNQDDKDWIFFDSIVKSEKDREFYRLLQTTKQ